MEDQGALEGEWVRPELGGEGHETVPEGCGGGGELVDCRARLEEWTPLELLERQLELGRRLPVPPALFHDELEKLHATLAPALALVEVEPGREGLDGGLLTVENLQDLLRVVRVRRLREWDGAEYMQQLALVELDFEGAAVESADEGGDHLVLLREGVADLADPDGQLGRVHARCEHFELARVEALRRKRRHAAQGQRRGPCRSL